MQLKNIVPKIIYVMSIFLEISLKGVKEKAHYPDSWFYLAFTYPFQDLL